MKYALVALVLLTACSHAEPKRTAKKAVPGTSIEAKQLAAEEEASYLAELTFQKDQRDLTAAEQKRLQEIIRQAKAAGTIEEVQVISWADAEYPSVHTKRLSETQRDLAEARNEKIREYLRAWDETLDVKTFNMAERPGVTARLLGAADARIKNTLEVAGIPNSDTTVKVPAKASKAMVLVRLQD